MKTKVIYHKTNTFEDLGNWLTSCQSPQENIYPSTSKSEVDVANRYFVICQRNHEESKRFYINFDSILKWLENLTFSEKIGFSTRGINLPNKQDHTIALRAENPFFTDIISRILTKNFKREEVCKLINLHYEHSVSNEPNEFIKDFKWVDTALFKVNNSLIKNIELVYLNLLQNISNDKKQEELPVYQFNAHIPHTQELCNIWLNNLVDWVTNLINKLNKILLLSIKRLEWNYVSILWIANFLSNCNLNIRAI